MRSDKLGELVNIQGGGTPDRSKSEYWGGQIPWASVKDFKTTALSTTQETITVDGLNSSATNLISAGAIIVPTRMALGKAAVNTVDLAINQDLKALQIKDSAVLDQGYLLRFLLSKASYIEEQGKGATVKGITLDVLRNLAVPLPALEEQKRIAVVLDKADRLRRKRQQAIHLADHFLRAVFLDMFGDPVTNPKGWPVKKLAEVGSLDRGVSKHRPRNDPSLLGGTHPLIQTGEVANCDGYIRSHTATYSDKGLAQSKLWPAGTLCITIAANIAKTGILIFDACFPDSVVGFSANNVATVEYVRFWLSFLQKTLEENAPESAQKNINLAILRNLSVPLPPLSELQKFEQIVNTIEELRHASRNSLNSSDALTASLQNEFFG